MIRYAFGSSLLFGLGVMMTGCGDDGSSVACDTGQVECDGVCIPEIQPTLAGQNGIQESVFDVSCAFSSCHGTEGVAQAELELSSAAVSQSNLIDVDSTEVDKLRVAPGDPGASYLLDKLLGQNLAPGTAQMPNIGIPLCDVKIQAVEDWITAGAN
jgi:hypothetical protein